MEKNAAKIVSDELLDKVTGGIDTSKYSEQELARIFDLYIDMYGPAPYECLPYLDDWGITQEDYDLIDNREYWAGSPYSDAPMEWKLAHIVYMKNH